MSYIGEFDKLFRDTYMQNQHMIIDSAYKYRSVDRFVDEAKNYSYPKNLFIDIFGNDLVYTDIRACALIDYLKEKYSERNFKIIEMRYKDNLPYAKIAINVDLSTECVRHILTNVHKSRYRANAKYRDDLCIKHVGDALHFGSVSIDSTTESDAKNFLIDDLVLSIDGYRKLYSMRIYTIQDLIQFTPEELCCYMKLSRNDILLIIRYLYRIGLELRQPMMTVSKFMENITSEKITKEYCYYRVVEEGREQIFISLNDCNFNDNLGDHCYIEDTIIKKFYENSRATIIKPTFSKDLEQFDLITSPEAISKYISNVVTQLDEDRIAAYFKLDYRHCYNDLSQYEYPKNIFMDISPKLKYFYTDEVGQQLVMYLKRILPYEALDIINLHYVHKLSYVKIAEYFHTYHQTIHNLIRGVASYMNKHSRNFIDLDKYQWYQNSKRVFTGDLRKIPITDTSFITTLMNTIYNITTQVNYSKKAEEVFTNAFNKLDHDRQLYIHENLMCNYSYEEIAQLHNISVHAAYSDVISGLRKIKEEIGTSMLSSLNPVCCLKNLSIDTLELPTDTFDKLRNVDINTIDDILPISYLELLEGLKIKRCDVDLIIQKMSDLGFGISRDSLAYYRRHMSDYR